MDYLDGFAIFMSEVFLFLIVFQEKATDIALKMGKAGCIGLRSNITSLTINCEYSSLDGRSC
jgi:hypothetical protein